MSLSSIADPAVTSFLRDALSSTPTGAALSIDVRNSLPLAINLMMIDAIGNYVFLGQIGADSNQNITPDSQNTVSEGVYMFAKLAATGGLFWIYRVQSSDSSITVGPYPLGAPSNVGKIPEPSDAAIVPLETPSVVVSIGRKDSAGNVVVREQFWKKTSNSFSVPPGGQIVLGASQSTGLEDATSSINTVTQTLSSSVSAGWGPVSASVSASLSVSNTNMHQVTTDSQSVRYHNLSYSNNNGKSESFIYWALADHTHVIKDGRVVASVVSSASPEVIKGPYNL